jgi:hypothetical protein
MTYVRLVEVAQSVKRLLHYHSGLPFAQMLLLGDVIKQFPALTYSRE